VPDPALERTLTSALAAALGRDSLQTRGWTSIGGGCISEAARFESDAGAFFAKWNPDAPAGLFESEALGLKEMASAGSSLSIPAVVTVSGEGARPSFIVMEYLETQEAPSPADEETLGRGLAELHRSPAPRFGFARDTYCGATRQANAWSDSWPEFFATRRLVPLLDAITNERGTPARERDLYDRLVARLPELLAAEATPALIHGDLWSGNVLWTPRGPALVDPACAYAEREMEFGITTLFGGLTPRAFGAYEEAHPLRPGWRERNRLYQLYHLLNHHLLFGGGYGAQALRIARSFVG
jgi:protein-ribulosamine 3-kinase